MLYFFFILNTVVIFCGQLPANRSENKAIAEFLPRMLKEMTVHFYTAAARYSCYIQPTTTATLYCCECYYQLSEAEGFIMWGEEKRLCTMLIIICWHQVTSCDSASPEVRSLIYLARLYLTQRWVRNKLHEFTTVFLTKYDTNTFTTCTFNESPC